MDDDPDCLFCSLARGRLDAEVVCRTETTLALRDLTPQAPTHVLVIPLAHHRDILTMAADAPELVGDLHAAIAEVVRTEGLGGQFRLVFNTGAEAGQSVFHVHAHVLGGRPMGWPPG